MAKFICDFLGVRGRKMRLYDTKCEISTDVTFGSVLANNATDGIKTIFFKDVVGVQFKESKLAIGYLQLETPSMQMNNKGSNFFSENTFTFEEGKNGINNKVMRVLYQYLVDTIEELKYGVKVVTHVPDFATMIANNLANEQPAPQPMPQPMPQPAPQPMPQPMYAPMPPQGAPMYQAPPTTPLSAMPSVNNNSKTWICDKCGDSNSDTTRYCSTCGNSKK